MTMSVQNPSVPFGAFEIFQFTNKRFAIVELIKNWGGKRATRKALSQMTVSQLEDIGVSGGYRGDKSYRFNR